MRGKKTRPRFIHTPQRKKNWDRSVELLAEALPVAKKRSRGSKALSAPKTFVKGVRSRSTRKRRRSSLRFSPEKEDPGKARRGSHNTSSERDYPIKKRIKES